MSFRSRRRTFLALAAVGLALAGPATAEAGRARLTIPKLGLDVQLAATLTRGPVAYYQDADTLGIAGHRSTHTRPFANVPKLRRGDVVKVDGERFTVTRTAIVRPHEVWILRFRGVVLSACHPAGSAAYRFVVFAAPA